MSELFVTPVGWEQSSRQLGQPRLVGLRGSKLLKGGNAISFFCETGVMLSVQAILSSVEAQV